MVFFITAVDTLTETEIVNMRYHCDRLDHAFWNFGLEKPLGIGLRA